MVRRLVDFTQSTRFFRAGQRRVFRMMLSMRGNPKSIALGAAIGVFVAFTPTVGLQMIIAAALATLFRASRPAAIIPVWITNPATIPPIYLFVYRVGKIFCDGPPAKVVYDLLVNLAFRLGKLQFYEFFGQFKVLLQATRDIMLPMTVGGIIVGGFLGILTYPLTLYGFRSFHTFMEKRQAYRQAHKHRLHLFRRKKDEQKEEEQSSPPDDQAKSP